MSKKNSVLIAGLIIAAIIAVLCYRRCVARLNPLDLADLEEMVRISSSCTDDNFIGSGSGAIVLDADGVVTHQSFINNGSYFSTK